MNTPPSIHLGESQDHFMATGTSSSSVTASLNVAASYVTELVQ